MFVIRGALCVIPALLAILAAPALADECTDYREGLDALIVADDVDAFASVVGKLAELSGAARAAVRAGAGVRKGSRALLPAFRASFESMEAAIEALAELQKVLVMPGKANEQLAVNAQNAALESNRKARVAYHELYYYFVCVD